MESSVEIFNEFTHSFMFCLPAITEGLESVDYHADALSFIDLKHNQGLHNMLHFILSRTSWAFTICGNLWIFAAFISPHCSSVGPPRQLPPVFHVALIGSEPYNNTFCGSPVLVPTF